MGLFDNIDDLAKKHESKIKDGIEKAGDMVDEKTDGKHADKVDRAQEIAHDELSKHVAQPPRL